MPDDAAPLLIGAGQIAGHIHQGEQRNIEGVAKANETGGLIRCVDIKSAAHDHGLVGDDADHVAVETGEAHNDILGKKRMGLKEDAIVNYGGNDIFYIIGLARVVGNKRVEFCAFPVGAVAGVGMGRIFHIV